MHAQDSVLPSTRAGCRHEVPPFPSALACSQVEAGDRTTLRSPASLRPGSPQEHIYPVPAGANILTAPSPHPSPTNHVRPMSFLWALRF